MKLIGHLFVSFFPPTRWRIHFLFLETFRMGNIIKETISVSSGKIIISAQILPKSLAYFFPNRSPKFHPHRFLCFSWTLLPKASHWKTGKYKLPFSLLWCISPFKERGERWLGRKEQDFSFSPQFLLTNSGCLVYTLHAVNIIWIQICKQKWKLSKLRLQ